MNLGASMPVDPFSMNDDTNIYMHEMLVSLVNAGFTEEQGMQIICTALLGSMLNPQETEEE